jgi:predicted restriction endonuclease
MVEGSIREPDTGHLFSRSSTRPLPSPLSDFHLRLGRPSSGDPSNVRTQSRNAGSPLGRRGAKICASHRQAAIAKATFREAVIAAYGGRCAFSGLPEPLLLDAAHIIADKDERLGQPVVTNGVPLSKIHHAAFDAHLIGIDPDFRMHVSDRLLDQNDGPMLEALKQLNGRNIRLPGRIKDHPDIRETTEWTRQVSIQ